MNKKKQFKEDFLEAIYFTMVAFAGAITGTIIAFILWS